MQTISAVTFERAAREIRLYISPWGAGFLNWKFACMALETVGANKAEKRLFEKMHKPRGSPEGSRWFGSEAEFQNQRFRKTILREVALNLRAQGFVIGGKSGKQKVLVVPDRSKARKK